MPSLVFPYLPFFILLPEGGIGPSAHTSCQGFALFGSPALMQVYRALYTHQKTKKAKTWQDGFVKYNEETRSATLYSASNEQLSNYKCPASKSFEIGEEYDIGRFLIQLDSLATENEMKSGTENQQESINESGGSNAKRFKTMKPFKVPLAAQPKPGIVASEVQSANAPDTNAMRLNDSDLLDYLNGDISNDKVSALVSGVVNSKSEFLTADCMQRPLSFSSGEGDLVRKTEISPSFSSIAQYKNSFANALWEIIQLNVTKMYRDISKDISSPSSTGQSSWPVHSVSCIKESLFKIGRNDLFMEKKIVITIGDAKKEEFSKDDLWIVFDKQLANYFIAFSSFHGPNTQKELELKVFKWFQFSPLLRDKLIGKKCLAIKNGEICSEILLFTQLKDPNFDFSALENHLLNVYRPLKLDPLGKLVHKCQFISTSFIYSRFI